MKGVAGTVSLASGHNVNNMYKVRGFNRVNLEDGINNFIIKNPNYRVVSMTTIDTATILVLFKEEK